MRNLELSFILMIAWGICQMPICAQQPPSWDGTFGCGISGSTPEGENSLPESYTPICTDPDNIKYIRVVVHFLLPEDIVQKTLFDCNADNTPFTYIGAGNFTETGDGYTNSNYNGYQRAEDIIRKANEYLDANADQWRKANDPNVQNPPLNITYPTTPPEVKVRYLLTGVFFHRDNNAYYFNIPSWVIFDKYGVEKDNTLNIFYTPVSPLNPPGSGFANALGGSIKYNFNFDYYEYVKPACRQWSIRYSASLLNHEIGHNLWLWHTWGGETTDV